MAMVDQASNLIADELTFLMQKMGQNEAAVLAQVLRTLRFREAKKGWRLLEAKR